MSDIFAKRLLTARRIPSLPEPAKDGASLLTTTRLASGKVDGRSARRTHRIIQFNTKVRPEFLDSFDAAMSEEANRLQLPISRPYFLELLLTSWQREKGKAIAPFGLSGPTLAAAEAIAKKMGWDISDVIVDALAARCRDLGLTEGKSRTGKL